MKNQSSTIIIIAVLVGMVGLIWFVVTKSPTQDPSIIARSGIHWHPELKIVIKGEEQRTPEDVGLRQTGEHPMERIHTHDDSGTLHIEFPGLVYQKDLRLSEFFKVWDKKFSRECIFDKCNGPEGQVKFLVNGAANDQFENYEMKDGDKIEIRFE